MTLFSKPSPPAQTARPEHVNHFLSKGQVHRWGSTVALSLKINLTSRPLAEANFLDPLYLHRLKLTLLFASDLLGPSNMIKLSNMHLKRQYP